jgi:hypothetical protein
MDHADDFPGLRCVESLLSVNHRGFGRLSSLGMCIVVGARAAAAVKMTLPLSFAGHGQGAHVLSPI